ncbi:hypothetical protein A2U01_0107636, partial [Trifolium medium]|nr:hypothetical protein [Trifolium medium]
MEGKIREMYFARFS